jgi:hypothetical protein
LGRGEGEGEELTSTKAKGGLSGVSEWSQREAVRHRHSEARSQTENWEVRVNQSKAKREHVPELSNTHVTYRTFPAEIEPTFKFTLGKFEPHEEYLCAVGNDIKKSTAAKVQIGNYRNETENKSTFFPEATL